LNPVGSTSDPVEVSWTSKDALLYAVGIGAGHEELAFTTENTNGVDQLVFPTFPVVIGWGRGSAMRNIGSFNPALLVHGQQAVTLHHPIPVDGTASITSELVAMYDKGKAAVVVTESRAVMDGEPLYTNTSSAFIRGEGGWGGDRGPSGPKNVPPERDPGSRRVVPDLDRPGVRLSVVRRSQSVAHRSGVRSDRRVRPSDPARTVQLRIHRPSAAARGVRVVIRRGSTTSRPASRRPCCPVTRSRQHVVKRRRRDTLHH
jgi:hypothetical protein